jgi:plastocyanin
MRTVELALVVDLGACSTQPPARVQQVAQSPGEGATITVQLSDFAFEPDHLRLKAGNPVRLRLVNDSGGDHDFSAPAFFAVSILQPGSSAPPDGGIEVAAHQTVEIALVPKTPGTYPLECTHFLHDLFGMNGTIEVVP